MKPILLLLLVGGLASATPYSYNVYNASGIAFGQSDLTNWNANSGSTNGSVACGGQGGSCPVYSTTFGSLIYTTSVPAAYEIAVNLDGAFVLAGGGVQIYLHATSNAILSPTGSGDQGTFDAISLYSPTCATDGSCTINMSYFERSAGTTHLLAFTAIPYQAGERVRAVAYGSSIGLLVNKTYHDLGSGLSGGYPGVGATGNTSGVIDTIQIGPQCTTVPAAIQASSMVYSAYPNSISLNWTEPTQPADVAAVGIVTWYCSRNSGWNGSSYNAATWTDATTSPSTAYTYRVAPVSFHGIAAPWSTAITVDTPSANNIDPRRTGLMPLGTYTPGIRPLITTCTLIPRERSIVCIRCPRVQPTSGLRSFTRGRAARRFTFTMIQPQGCCISGTAASG